MTRKPTVAAAKKPAAAPRRAAAAKAVAKPAAKGTPEAGAAKKAGGGQIGGAAAVKLKDLLEQVAARASVKKKDARPVIEATLAILGEVLAAGGALVLPPLGRVRVSRTRDAANGATLTIKLKRAGGAKKSGPGAEEDLAGPLE